MTKLKRKFLFNMTVLCSFLLLFTGCSAQKTDNPSPTGEECEIDQQLPKNKLSIYASFKQLTEPVYVSGDEAFIDFSIQLTDEGERYVRTNLFNEIYQIELVIKDVDTQEVLTSFHDLTWDVNEKKDFHLQLEIDEATKKLIEQKLESITNNEYKISYGIDMSPQNDASMILSDLGFLDKK